MGNAIRRVVALTAGCLSSACTTHLATQVDNPSHPMLSGIPYRLAERQIRVEARWILDSCDIVGDKVEIGFANDASFTDELVEGKRLAIDYTDMTNRFKTGQVDVSYWKVGEGANVRQTGLLKSFNGEIKGEEAAALKAGIGAVASAAKLVLAATGVLPPAGRIDDLPELVCNPLLFAADATPGAIPTLKKGAARLKVIAKKVEEATTKMALIRTRTIGSLSPADQIAFDKLNTDVEALAKEKEVIEATKALFYTSYSVTKEMTLSDFTMSDALPQGFAADSAADVVRIIRPDTAKLMALVGKAIVCNPDAGLSEASCASKLEGAVDGIKGQFEAGGGPARTLLLMNVDLPEVPQRSSPLSAGQSIAGLVYREPENARVWLSRPEISGVQAMEKLTERTVSVPQLGRVVVLPLRSRFAEKNGLSAEFEPDGRPSKISYKAIEAGGTAMAESLKLALDETGGLVNTVRAAREAEKTEKEGAQLAAVKDQIALLTEQQKLAELSKAPDPEAAAREAELQLLRFEKERAELRKAISSAPGS